MKRRKKILFLHNSLNIGGAERLRAMLLKNIDRSKYDIRICCIANKGLAGMEIEKMGYSVDELGLSSGPMNVFTIFSVINYLKKQDIDILHTSLFNSNFHGRIAAIACGIKNVITEEHSESYQYQKPRHIFYILSDFLLSKVTRFIICCSDPVREDIIKREKIKKEKLITVKNAIDPSIYTVTESRESVRKRYGAGDDVVVFITPASFGSKKGHRYFLEALGEIKKKGFKFKYFLAGKGPLEKSLRSRAKDLKLKDNVVFLGAISDIENFLSASDIFVLPSLKEGLSVALLEAMFMGLSCIVTDVGANRDLINDRINGIIVEPGNKDSLVEAVLHFFNNKNDIGLFGKNAKKRIETGYMIEDYVKAFSDIWDKINVN